jgi:hypothetical protein
VLAASSPPEQLLKTTPKTAVARKIAFIRSSPVCSAPTSMALYR